MDAQLAAYLRQALSPFKAKLDLLSQEVAMLKATGKPTSPEDALNAIQGRRMTYWFVGTQTFTTAQDGLRGNPINFLVSQDGPFVLTHAPIAIWRPTLPTTATNFGRWRSISSWPSNSGFPTQDDTTNNTWTDDVVDLSWELIDGGSQRNMQNLPAPAAALSTVNELKKLPCPTKFETNTTIQFIPTYENIVFGGATPTTQGTMVIALPGYRIVGTVHS